MTGNTWGTNLMAPQLGVPLDRDRVVAKRVALRRCHSVTVPSAYQCGAARAVHGNCRVSSREISGIVSPLGTATVVMKEVTPDPLSILPYDAPRHASVTLQIKHSATIAVYGR